MLRGDSETSALTGVDSRNLAVMLRGDARVLALTGVDSRDLGERGGVVELLTDGWLLLLQGDIPLLEHNEWEGVRLFDLLSDRFGRRFLGGGGLSDTPFNLSLIHI